MSVHGKNSQQSMVEGEKKRHLYLMGFTTFPPPVIPLTGTIPCNVAVTCVTFYISYILNPLKGKNNKHCWLVGCFTQIKKDLGDSSLHELEVENCSS